MLTDPPFVGLLLVCFFVVVNFPQEEVIGGKFLLLIEGAPGLNSLGTENSTTAKPQLYPDHSHIIVVVRRPQVTESMQQIVKDV